MLRVFSLSDELKGFVESHGWTLYDAAIPEDADPFYKWEVYERNGPAPKILDRTDYIFAPMIERGQSLREAYAAAGCMGPCIEVASLEDHAEMDGDLPFTVNGKLVYTISRLRMMAYRGRDAIELFTPIEIIPTAPRLVIPNDFVMKKFKRHFRIIPKEEFYAGLNKPAVQ